MTRARIPALSLLVLLCAVSLGSANGFDPNKIPRIGSVAPAFGLPSFRQGPASNDKQDVIQLDGICGLRSGKTKGVLLLFVEAAQLEDLELVNTWHRRFSRQGLEVIGISVDSKPIEFASKVGRLRLRFPVLDDRHRIVAQRYGVTDTPFSMLLNRECRVLGFSNKKLSEEEEGLVGSIESLMNDQIGQPSGSMD
jgi:hypothetical protein